MQKQKREKICGPLSKWSKLRKKEIVKKNNTSIR